MMAIPITLKSIALIDPDCIVFKRDGSVQNIDKYPLESIRLRNVSKRSGYLPKAVIRVVYKYSGRYGEGWCMITPCSAGSVYCAYYLKKGGD